MAMLTYLEPFIQKLTAERQMSVHTVNNYRRDVEYFFQWLSGAELGTLGKLGKSEQLERRSIQLYVARLSREKKSPATIARKLSALRQYFDFLITQGQLTDNPAENVKAPKKAKLLPKALPVDDINQLLDNPQDIFDFSNPLDVRDCAILELLYSAGVRVAELASLNVNDLDLKRGKASVIGKGNKQREIFLGSKAIIAQNITIIAAMIVTKA